MQRLLIDKYGFIPNIIDANTLNLNEYNVLRRVTDAVRAADSAFCKNFYNNEPLTEKTFELLKNLLDNLSDLYSISDMIIDNETYRRNARKRRRIVAG